MLREREQDSLKEWQEFPRCIEKVVRFSFRGDYENQVMLATAGLRHWSQAGSWETKAWLSKEHFFCLSASTTLNKGKYMQENSDAS